MGVVHIAANLREKNKKYNCTQRKICNSLNGNDCKYNESRAQSDFASLTVSIKVPNVNITPIEMPHKQNLSNKHNTNRTNNELQMSTIV